jgi:hypothetical protein
LCDRLHHPEHLRLGRRGIRHSKPYLQPNPGANRDADAQLHFDGHTYRAAVVHAATDFHAHPNLIRDKNIFAHPDRYPYIALNQHALRYSHIHNNEHFHSLADLHLHTHLNTQLHPAQASIPFSPSSGLHQ